MHTLVVWTRLRVPCLRHKQFEQGKLSLENLHADALKNGEPEIISGKQEYLENLINRFI